MRSSSLHRKNIGDFCSGSVEKLITLHFSNKFIEKRLINVPLGHFWARLSNPDSKVEDSHLDDRVVAVDGLVKERQDDWRKSKLKTSKYKSCYPVISLKKLPSFRKYESW